jgi:O-antigen ligase/polysaccharide polymerase Wzy-like membrane protein
MRLSSLGQIVLSANVPLYGTLVALDASRPPIPPLVPSVVTVAIGLLALAALAAVVPAAVRAARPDLLTLAFLAPGTASMISSLTGFDPPIGIGLSTLVLGLGGAGLALARDVDAATARACLRAFLWSALASCVLALIMVVTHRPVALYAYDNGRAVGTFLNPNELAGYTLVGLGIALPLAAVGRDRLAAITAVVLLVTLGATFSRWGALCAVCGVAVYALASRARVLLVAALVVAVAGIGLDALAGAQHHNPRDTESRAVAWRAGLTTFARFPLLGVGPLAFPRTYDALRPPEAPGPQTPVAFDPHSLPIAFAADGGILAVVTLTVSFTIILRRVFREARGAKRLPRALALGLAAGLIALMIDCGINTISIFFALSLQVVPLALAVLRTDAI